MTDVRELVDLSCLKKLPSWIEPRVGEAGGQLVLVLRAPKEERHNSCPLICFSEEMMKVQVANLGDAIFEQKYPGWFAGFVKRKAKNKEEENDKFMKKLFDLHVAGHEFALFESSNELNKANV